MPWRFRQASARATDASPAALEQASVEQDEDIHPGPKFLGWRPGSEEDGSATTSLRGTFTDGFNLSSTQSTWRSKDGSSMRSTGLLPRIAPAGVESSNEPRAMWSDADEFDSSDGFDMKRWRREHAAELKAAARSRQQAGDSPTRKGSQRPKRHRRNARWASRSSRVSPLPYVPYAKPPTADRAAITEMSSHSHDPGVDSLILRDDVRFVVAKQEMAEAERTQRRKTHYQEVGRESRRRASQWHKRKVQEQKGSNETTEGAPELKQSKTIASTEDDDEDTAKSSRIKSVMNRIRCLDGRNDPPDPVTGPLASGPTGAEENSGGPGKRIRDRIKYVVTCRLQQRRRQARKLASLKDLRAARAKAMPASQQGVMQFAFEPYQRFSGNQKTIAVSDIHYVLLEAGLGGQLCLEKWSVGRVCREIVFALALEYGSFERMPPISTFRGSLKKEGGQTEAPEPPKGGNAFLAVVNAAKAATLTSSHEDPRPTLAPKFGRMTEHEFNMEGIKSLQEEVQRLDSREEGESQEVANQGRKTATSTSGCANALRSARKFMMSRPLGYEDFCTEIVPAVRAELAEMRQDMHFEHFMKVLEGNNSVHLSHEQFRRLNVRLGIDADLVQQAMESMGMAQPADGDSAAAEDGTSGDPEAQVPDSKLDFESVHELLLKLEEQNEHRRRRHEREIKEEFNLSDAVFWEHRMELIRLKDYFQIYDADNSGHLSHKEVCWLLKHVGFQPYKFHESRIIARLLSESDKNKDESMDFVEFLSLMAKVRQHQIAQREGRLRPIFQKFARDNGNIELDDVNRVLEEVGVIGKTRQEQDMIHKLIFECDADEKAELGFQDTLALCQRVQEHVLSGETDNTVRFANSLGIDKQRLAEYLWAFDQYDKDGSAGLAMNEIMEVLRMLMVRPPTNQEVQDLYAEIRVKPTEEVTLHQYLRLMQVASSGRGMFSKELPYTLRGVPQEKLRDILRIFALSDSYVRELEAAELPELVGSYLGVGTDSNLREDLAKPVGNTRQLLEYAHKVHISKTQAFMPIGGSISTEKARNSAAKLNFRADK